MTPLKKAHALLKKGYQVVPISPEGRPLLKNFLDQTTTYHEGDAKSWLHDFEGAGLALVAGKNDVYALDFDIDDHKIAKRVRKYVEKHWPDLPIRTCNHPRFATLFQADHDVLKYTNATSDRFKLKGGEINQIEMIGHKTITLFGKHRTTGKPYRWSKNTVLTKTKAENLPVLDLKDVKKLFKYFARNVGPKYKHKSDSSFSKPNKKATFETARSRRVFNHDEVEDILAKAKGNDRDSWIAVGMGLHVHYGGSEEGLDRWDEWSSQFKGYVDKQDCRTQWASFKESGGRTLATVAAQIDRRKKRKAKKKAPTLKNFLKTKVLITQGELFGDLEKLPNESVIKLREANTSYSNCMVEKKVQDQRSGEWKVKDFPLMREWLNHPKRVTCQGAEYFPCRQRLIKDKWDDRHLTYYNTYVPTMCEVAISDDLVHHFKDHMEYLFPGPGDAAWMINWMAQLVQQPDVRYRATPLSISTFHGTGRGWLNQLLEKLVGRSNLSTVPSIGEIVRPGAKTGFLYNTVLCIVPETYARGGQQYEVDNRLRTIIGDSRQNVDLKWGEQGEREIFTRLFLQSNHTDALVLTDEDNRIEVLISRQREKSKEYYARLYQLLKYDPDFVNQVYTYLINYNVNTAALQTARRSAARETLIDATRSKLANSFFQFKTVIGENWFHKNMMIDFMARHAELNDSGDISTITADSKELNYLFRQEVLAHERVPIGGKLTRVSAFAPVDDSLNPKALKKSLKKSRRLIELYFTQPERGKHE